MIAKPDETAEAAGERMMAEVARMRAEAEAAGYTPARAAAERAAYKTLREAYPNQYVAYREKWSADNTAVEYEVLAVGPTAVAVTDELDRRHPDRQRIDVRIDFCEWDPTGARAWRILHLPRRGDPGPEA